MCCGSFDVNDLIQKVNDVLANEQINNVIKIHGK